MAEAARHLGRPAEAEMWSRRAGDLRRSIRARLLLPGGRFAYFLHENGAVEEREHCLATAFAILHGVLEGEAAIRACRNYPIHWWGVPLFHPFYPNQEYYHNNSSWPFASAFFLRAREKALGTDESEVELALIARSCRGDTFHEWCAANTHTFFGQPAQLWTIGPFIGRCLDRFNPCSTL